jgi:hypothetical protein
MPTFPKVNNVSVSWENPLDVPSGGNGYISPRTWALTVVDASPAVGETWYARLNGALVSHTVTDTDPGAPVVPQTQNQIAASLELLIEAASGVSSAAVANVVTAVPVAPLADLTVSSPATSGGGTFTAASSGTPTGFDPQPTPG